MKKSREKSSVFRLIAAVLLITILLVAGVRALMIYIPQSNASQRFEALKNEVDIKDVNAEELLEPSRQADNQPNNGLNKDAADIDSGVIKLSEMNPDFSGWLSIEDTIIDYPVMKSAEDDPEYYLHRDFNGNDSYSGTLFIGEGCDADSDVFVIYGHNMNAGTMFGSLDNYKDANFAAEHKNIVFRTPRDTRVYRVFAAFQTKIYTEPVNQFEYYRAVGECSRDEYQTAVESVRGMSLISLNEAPAYPQQILFLSTCAYHTDNGRFVVAAYRFN